MAGDRYIVRGVEVIAQPYSEKKYKQLATIQAEIDGYIAKNPELTFDEVPAELKGKWWKAKGDILWKTANGVELDEAFYAHEEFESGVLKRVQDFFLINRLFL